MAVDIYDSQYLLILAPSLVIALMFLFFWLFMKETSYDEVLARHKRDLKLPLSKPDVRKKNDKKKSKKKESAGGAGSGGVGGGGESEEDQRDFEATDAASSSSPEVEDEPAAVVLPTAAPVSTAPAVEAPSGLRERKKREKRAAKAAAAAAAAPAPPSPPGEPEMNGAKPAGRKTEPPLAVNKQASSASLQPDVQPQVQVQAPVVAQVQTPPLTSGKKREKKKQKVEAVDEQQQEAKVEQVGASAPVKDVPLMAENRSQDSLPSSTTSGKKKNATKKQKAESVDDSHVLADSATPANHQAAPNDNVSSKGSGKKQKNETDKENAEMKLKELLSGLASLALSEAEAVSVMAILCDKSPHALESWHKAAPATQEREKLLGTLQEEASIAKDKVKQLSQELQVEKQKTNRVESMMREQHSALQKELGGMQAKTQSGYQELQAMQIKFQQMREQLESQISRLQQENGILRDAVSSATNQMESKNSAELNKLRSEYTGLMKELAENTGKLQQEEHQRKSLEVGYKQNVSQLEAQLQDAKRRWDELQNYLHNVNAEREKLQAAKQELQSQLLAVETEMNSKNKEIQNLHSSLTETMVSKERVEHKVLQLLEASQHSMPDDTLQVQVQELLSENKGLQVQIESLQVQNENLQAQISSQATHISHFEELQKLLAEKELQRKSLEDALNAERSSGAGRETNMQAMHNDNMALKAELQKLQAQISEQTASQMALDQIQKSVQEREENIKTVEELLKTGLIEVANKEEELKAVRDENEALKRNVEALTRQSAEQASSETTVEELKIKLQEKEDKLRSVEESLQAALGCSAERERNIAALEQQQLAALQTEKEQQRQKEILDEQTVADNVAHLQELHVELGSKDAEIQALQAELETRTKEVSEKVVLLQQSSQRAEPSAELLAALSEKESQVSALQRELSELREALDLHRKKNNENQTALDGAQAECRDVLHRLLPHVPLPSQGNQQEWLLRFQQAASESSMCAPASGDLEGLQEKLSESEEAQRVLQKDCETYKKVLAETEGILQRLQSSVESEESRWRMKLDVSEAELREMNLKVGALETEMERLCDGEELENMRRDKQHLAAELDRAERESATYVTEVRELKSQLTQTLSKLQTEESERQKVAADLHKAQQSLDLIQEELSKETGNADHIENSSLSSQTEEIDRKEKMTTGLHQTVRELQQLIQAVNRQLTKGQEGEADKDLPEV